MTSSTSTILAAATIAGWVDRCCAGITARMLAHAFGLASVSLAP